MLINMRNAMMAGKRLPYDNEVEYLESTGAQWIDTGVPYDSSVDCECVMAKTSNTIPGYLFGILWASGGSSTVRRWAVFLAATGELWPQYATTTNVSGPTLLQNGVIYKLQANSTTFAVDNTSVNVTSTTFDPTTDVSIYIFARHTYAPQLDPNPVSGLQAFRLYSFKIWQNGVLVRDFIPVRKGTVGYLYDRVSGKLFGNAGTGDFVVGPDVVPVEYIESHGTERIDIPVTGTPDKYFGIKGLVKITNTSQRTKAVWDTETDRQFGSSGYDMPGASYIFASWVGAKNVSGGWVVSPGVLYPFEVSTLGRTLNGEFQSLPRNITSAFSTLRLFGKYGTAEYIGNASVAFGALTITDGLGIERKPFPVRVGTEGAMMDVLTRRIYRNAGTGAFTYGNDLKYPIPAE